MAALPALFLDVTAFAKTHGIGRDRVLRLMDIGVIPEIESEGTKRYVDLVELHKRIDAGQFVIEDVNKEDEL